MMGKIVEKKEPKRRKSSGLLSRPFEWDERLTVFWEDEPSLTEDVVVTQGKHW